MNVYGISGLKGHGKDTLAKYIQSERVAYGEGPAFKVTHFATRLKTLCKHIFRLTEADMHDMAKKESPLPRPIAMDLYLTSMRKTTGLNITIKGKIAKTPREVMQYFGTEYVREAQDDYWIQCVLKEIKLAKDFVLIPDTRYPNEADAIRSIGGRVIKVERTDFPSNTDGHSSETEMAKIDPDLVIGTVTDNFSLQTRIARHLAAEDFTTAFKYDYRQVKDILDVFTKGGADTNIVAKLLNLPTVEAEFILDYYKVICPECLGYRIVIPKYPLDNKTPCPKCSK